jgi:hypothetical protein
LNTRNTITIKNEVYTRLRNYGKFGESFSSLIVRILDEFEGGKKASYLRWNVPKMDTYRLTDDADRGSEDTGRERHATGITGTSNTDDDRSLCFCGHTPLKHLSFDRLDNPCQADGCGCSNYVMLTEEQKERLAQLENDEAYLYNKSVRSSSRKFLTSIHGARARQALLQRPIDNFTGLTYRNISSISTFA